MIQGKVRCEVKANWRGDKRIQIVNVVECEVTEPTTKKALTQEIQEYMAQEWYKSDVKPQDVKVKFL